jgi:hypothetical protein
MSRHPYTYAADYVRSLPQERGDDGISCKLSRSDASQIISGIAEALSMERRLLAIQLSEYFQKHQDEIAQRTVAAIARHMGGQIEEPRSGDTDGAEQRQDA